ncbi:MAG: hypothetical protein JWQ04_2966 [Pedosphaera sp.]|nr:hypothetical protein [Pedosphaera sp.]
MNEEHFTNTINSETVLFDGDHVTGIENFPYSKVFSADESDRGNPLAAIVNEPSPQHYELAGEGFARILDWMWRTGPSDNMRSAFRKFVAVSALLRPDLLGELNYVQLAEKLGCRKATISKIVVEFEEVVCGGIQFRTSRLEGARTNMRLARMAQVANGKPSPWAIHKAAEAERKAKLPRRPDGRTTRHAKRTGQAKAK